MKPAKDDAPLTPEEELDVDRQGEYIAWQQQVNREIADRQKQGDGK